MTLMLGRAGMLVGAGVWCLVSLFGRVVGRSKCRKNGGSEVVVFFLGVSSRGI